MSGVSNFVSRGNGPPPAAANNRRQQIADQIRMPAPRTTLHRVDSTSTAVPADARSFGNILGPSNTPLEVKQEQSQSQSQQKHHDAFDTDVEDFDSTTTLAVDEELKKSQPKAQSPGYVRHGLGQYSRNDGTGKVYAGAVDKDIQQLHRVTRVEDQRYPEQVTTFAEEEEAEEEEGEEGEEGEEEEEQEEEKQEAEEEEEEEGESGDEADFDGDSQDGNRTVDLTNMDREERAMSMSEKQITSLMHQVQRSSSGKVSLPFSPAPPGTHQRLPVRNTGNELHAPPDSYPLNMSDTGDAESPSYPQPNRAPQRPMLSGTTGQKMHHQKQQIQSQHMLNGNGLPQQTDSWNGTTRHKPQRSRPQVLQHESLPSPRRSQPVSGNVGRSMTLPQTQLEPLEDRTMSSNFDASDLGEDYHASAHPAELFANRANDLQDDFRPQGQKRPFQLDYDQVQLSEMTFEELKKQPFDHNPQALPSTLPNDVANSSLGEKLKYVMSSLKADSEKGQKRQRFFSSLTINEHEDCGDMIVGQFSDLLQKFKDARQDKRKLAMAYEEEVANREERVRAKRELLEKDLDRLKRAGQDVVRGK